MLITVHASSDIKLTVGSIAVRKGTGSKTVDIPITISNNTGIIGMTLTITYGEGLSLTGVTKGTALASLTMTKPGKFSDNPVKVTWDGEAENDDGNGTAVTLSFTVPKDTEKEYPIEISVSGVVDENLNKLDVTIENGKIAVENQSHTHSHGDWVKDNNTTHSKICACGDIVTENHIWNAGVVTTPATQTTTGIKTFTCFDCNGTKVEIIPMIGDDNTNAIKLAVANLTVEKGTNTESVEVPIAIFNNTGIIGMTLTINYGEGLILTAITQGDAFTTLTMTKPGDFSANPIKITWDGEDKNDAGNGTVATLSFTVPKDVQKDYHIEITVGGVIDENLTRLDVESENGKISVSDISSANKPVLDSGIDSNGIRWILYESGILDISGNGAMTDYSKTLEIPWYANRLHITEINVGSNITHLAERAFYGCVFLKKITIPDSVTSIGAYAFKNCDEITIYGESKSFAQSYATQNNIPFIDTNNLSPEKMTLEYVSTSKKMYFDVFVEDSSEDSIVYVALYNAYGKMIALISENLLSDDITSLSLDKNSDASYAKVFVWGSQAKPVTKSELVSDL